MEKRDLAQEVGPFTSASLYLMDGRVLESLSVQLKALASGVFFVSRHHESVPYQKDRQNMGQRKDIQLTNSGDSSSQAALFFPSLGFSPFPCQYLESR